MAADATVPPVAAPLLHLERPSAADPAAGMLVLHHGRGADERDLMPLMDHFDPSERLVGATPRGWLQIPPGGFHWYVVKQVGFPDAETFSEGYESLAQWLDDLHEATEVPIEKTVLGGFSQGAVMSWALALGPGRPRPAGVLAMSGFLPTVDGFDLAMERLEGLPVFIAHGTHDPVISVDFGRSARDQAEAAGAEVTYLETPIPHSVDPAVVPEIAAWLQEVLP
jgi:phospholipase/carboxylesterase